MYEILRREVLQHVRTNRFAALLVASIVLFLVNALVFSRGYQAQLRRCTLGISKTRAEPSTRLTTVHVAPPVLGFAAEAGDRYRPDGYTVKPAGVIRPLAENAGNYRMPRAPLPDWVFVVKVVFSLYVMLLAYGTIAAEREEGTLRLCLSYPVGRVGVLAGKYGAVMATVGLPLLIGMTAGLVVMVTVVTGLASVDAVARILGFVLVTMLFLSMMVLMSLLVSTLVKQSSVSLLVLLVVWVVWAVLIPNTAGIVAEGLSRAPSEYQVARKLGPVMKERVWGRIEEVKERAREGRITTEERLRKEVAEAFGQGLDDLNRHHDTYTNSVKARARRARAFSRLSPVALFEYGAAALAATGPDREQRVLKDVHAYTKEYDAYVLDKVGEVVAETDWYFSATVDLNGERVNIQSPTTQEYEGDKSDFPQFRESSTTLAQSVRAALGDIIGLLLWNLVLGAAAFWAILHTDVR